MGLFSKRNEVVDLTETVIPVRRNIEKQSVHERIDKDKVNSNTNLNTNSSSVLDFISEKSSSISNAPIESEKIDLPDVKIMLKNANQRIEDHSHELYKLLHKIELLEKKVERLENRG